MSKPRWVPSKVAEAKKCNKLVRSGKPTRRSGRSGKSDRRDKTSTLSALPLDIVVHFVGPTTVQLCTVNIRIGGIIYVTYVSVHLVHLHRSDSYTDSIYFVVLLFVVLCTFQARAMNDCGNPCSPLVLNFRQNSLSLLRFTQYHLRLHVYQSMLLASPL